MSKNYLGCVSLLAFWISFSPAQALAGTYEIDAGHSSVSFKIKHLVSTVKGQFEQFAGQIDFDPADLSTGRTEAVIQAASIDTNQEKRDEHLRSPDFFDATQFPEIVFKSKRVEGTRLVGDLTMHGVTREVTLDFEFYGIAKDPQGRDRAGFSAVGRLDRKDFDMEYNKVLDQGGLLLGEMVTIEIEVEAVAKS